MPLGEIAERMLAKRLNSPYKTWGWLRKELVAQKKNICDCCKEVVPRANFDVDHIVPLCLGGSDKEENLQILCHRCHAKKTAQDKAILAAARRLGMVKGRTSASGLLLIENEKAAEFYRYCAQIVKETDANLEEWNRSWDD